MPVVVTISIVVGTELGLLSVITKFAGVPSAAVALAIVTIGVGLLSVIVATPDAVVLLVLVLVTVAFKVKVSLGSSMLSAVVGTVTVTRVAPAGMVTVAVVVV